MVDICAWFRFPKRCTFDHEIREAVKILSDGTLPSRLPFSLSLHVSNFTHPPILNFQKYLNAISILLATVLSVSLLQLSGIHCLPACGISPPSLTSNPISKHPFFNRHFHRCTRLLVCVCVCVWIMFMSVCLFAWMVCAWASRFLVMLHSQLNMIECADLLEIRNKYFEEESLYSLFRIVIPGKKHYCDRLVCFTKYEVCQGNVCVKFLKSCVKFLCGTFYKLFNE